MLPTGPGCRRPGRRDARALDDLDRAYARTRFVPADGRRPKVRTALERGLLERLRRAGGQARRGRGQATTRWRHDPTALFVRDNVRLIAEQAGRAGGSADCCQAGGARSDVARARHDATCSTPTHPVLFGDQLLAHVQALRSSMSRPASITGTAGRGQPAPVRRWPGHHFQVDPAGSSPSRARLRRSSDAAAVDAVANLQLRAPRLLIFAAALEFGVAPVPARRGRSCCAFPVQEFSS